MKVVKTGQKYKHFKGNEYRIIALGKHTETLEDVVVYQKCKSSCTVWVRPLKSFISNKTHYGEIIERFTLMEDCNEKDS